MKDFLSIADYSPAELQELLELAAKLKTERAEKGINQPILENKVLALVFQKPSLRTRVSFDMGMRHLGGDALYLSPAEIGLGKRESIADVARVLSGYVDGVMARVFAHEHVVELAKWSDIPVINGLSDYNHPCQALADIFTVYEEFGKVKDINVTYVGDGNNVAVSLMHICAKLGANFTIANPAGYGMPTLRSRKPRPSLPIVDRALICWKTPTRRSRMPMRSTPTPGPAWARKKKPPGARRFSRLTR